MVRCVRGKFVAMPDDEPEMAIALHAWATESRACRFSLNLQGSCVFADFDVDNTGRVYAVRVSFDGYGCCTVPADIGRMSATDSAALLRMVQEKSMALADPLLRRYFRQIASHLWPDALEKYALV